MPTERRLAAIMFTDIVGYTALMAESEARGHRVRERQGQVLRPIVEQYAGDWVQHIGDETLASFPSATDAVNCALAIQAALRDEPELGVRVGIHVGEIVSRDGSVHGDGVNIASRVRPLAEPGGICVSDEVQHAIRSQENIETTPLGEQEFKNVGRPVSVYVVSGTPGEPPGRTPDIPVERRGDAAIQSLAVLPLENLSGDPEQEYFADGMTEALIGDLARIGSLRVISRTSVMQYKHERRPLREIALELDVDAIVEGSVMRAGDHVRITAQLIDARIDAHLWSDRYDRSLSDVLALQSDVARAIADQVRVELSPEEQAGLTTTRSVDPRAYDAYLQGIQLVSVPVFSVGSLDRRQAALEPLERAVELDPGFAEAWSALALIRLTLASMVTGHQTRGEYPKARHAALRALEIDPSLGQAHAVEGGIRLFYDWDFEGAHRSIEQGLRVSPNDPTALDFYAYLLVCVGRTEDGLAVSNQMIKVAPLDLPVRGQHLHNLLLGGAYEGVLEEHDRIRALDPDFASGPAAHAYGMLGRDEEAYHEWTRCFPGGEIRLALERGWSEGGLHGVYRGAVGLMEMDADRQSPREIALIHTYLGDREAAFAWLERALRERDPTMVILRTDPRYEPLRTDPRFDDLLRRIGFPED
jgi:TolB-like protein/class 3 adenylate cyclase